MSLYLKLLSILFIVSCAQVTSLNLKKHQFGKIPTKIIWLQVPGLDREHMALLKFSYPSRDRKTAFEDSLCVGNIWEYDLYNIRPESNLGTLAQLSGKKNINGSCSDYSHKPIWKYVAKKNYKAGVFEGELQKGQSILKALECKDSKEYLNEAVYWGMGEPQNKGKFFHVDDKKKYEQGKRYFDKSCTEGTCYTTFARNIEGAFNSFSKNTKNYVFIVRNFKYQNLLKKNKIVEAKSELEEINTVLKFFQDKAKNSSDTLVILSSSQAINLNFPKPGKQWRSFAKKGKYVRSVNTKLISPIYATGARAENFCGIYDQSQLLSRIFSGAKQQGLEFSIINPFQ